MSGGRSALARVAKRALGCGVLRHGRLREGVKKLLSGLGPPDPAFIERGEQNFGCFAAALDASLRGKTWLIGQQLTNADFAFGSLVPSAERTTLPVRDFPEILRWY